MTKVVDKVLLQKNQTVIHLLVTSEVFLNASINTNAIIS